MTDSWDAFSVVTLVEISLADLTTDGLVGVPDALHTASHTPASTYEGRTFGRRLALSTRKPEAERLLLTTDEILGRDDTGLAYFVRDARKLHLQHLATDRRRYCPQEYFRRAPRTGSGRRRDRLRATELRATRRRRSRRAGPRPLRRRNGRRGTAVHEVRPSMTRKIGGGDQLLTLRTVSPPPGLSTIRLLHGSRHARKRLKLTFKGV